ncbi:PREDICTED: vitellogenin-like [Dufourea novaeangliae]|uniref:Vitellogenin n=1 Tax=Dufourea novaeangliae TaxID=178035 RepID=A0A154NWB0_DUFNO|nr:PREDICTED: vitellogenin-like [Dufourea novaeangliae]KZC03969.1 Vitellogenin [Dufourea novaeangliae]
MWLPLTLLVFAGLVSADYDHGWRVGNEYTYLVRSRTLASLDKLSDQYTGVLLKALLTVQVKGPNTLAAKVWNGQQARIHKNLPNGWASVISDQMLELRDLPISGKPFEIKIKHGVIRDLIVEKNIPTWEVNMLKSIVSQLQVDTQGDNAIRTRSMQVPNDDQPYGMFLAMEDSVGGKCEVLYDITPLPEHMTHMKPELVPMPKLKGDGQHIDIMKTKNFSRCDQRMDYHFGITGRTNWEPGSNENGEFLSKSSTSRIIISGNLKAFTIQSSVTTSKLFVSPRFYDEQNGVVVSRMNLTLGDVKKISRPLSAPANPESTGNLVYVYNNPFSDMEERRLSKSLDGQNSKQNQASDSISSVSSSEEAAKNGQNPRIRGSSSSSASSSSISSSEENEFWQPKPTLEDAPQNPLLPDFVGDRGKYIGQSGEFEIIKVTKDLVLQISNDLEDPSNIPNQETLEKFTILSSLIRTMSRKQLIELENNMHISPNELKSNDKSQATKQNAWAAFRDAVTQAGTGPALLTIKNWIERRNVVGLEAADIVSRIPKNARTPTAEYVRSLFELATNPEVKKDKHLHVSAILAFTELLRHSQVNGRIIHNRYPVHTFGRPVSKHDTTLVVEYIPYLARELKNAIKEGDSPKIQTYILALGSIGHPKVLSVFEPFLEGKEPVTVFQRTLMVASLSKLSEIHPKIARSVLYKIYLNTMESHEVRCTAVFLLMKTNPALGMLQRMAEFTNYDTNKHVNSAVKTTIQSISMLTSPEWKDMASKARAALNLLSPNDYSYQYSRGFVSETINSEQNMLNRMIFNYIGSDDSIIPRSLYVGSFSSYGDFKTPPTELVAMLSTVKPILETMFKDKDDKNSGPMMTEKLAEELNIVPEEAIKLEGNVLFNSKFTTKFLPFDSQTLRTIPNWISTRALDMKNGGYLNENKLMAYEVTLSFPTETGLPFVYTFKMPILYKIIGQGQVKFDRDMSLSMKADTRILFSKKIQGRIGFLAPFDRQHFIAGVDMSFQTYAPVRVALDVSPVKRNMQLKLWPLKGEGKARLVHYSVVPYTSSHDIFSKRPLLTEKNTHKIQGEETVYKSQAIPMNDVKSLRLELEGDKTNDEFWNTNRVDGQTAILFPWTQTTDKYRKADLFMNLERDLQDPVILSASLDQLNVQPGSEDLKQWTQLAKAIVPSNTEFNGAERKKQLLTEVGKGIKAARSGVLDMQLQVPGELETRNALTVAWSDSNVENKQRVLLFWKLGMPTQNINYEVCVASQTESTPNTIPSYENAMKRQPKGDIDVDIRFGSTCADGEQINIKGQVVQNKELRETLQKSRSVRTCQEQMKQGNKILRACQTAASASKMWDELNLSIDVQSEPLRDLMNMAVDMIGNSDYIDASVDTTSPKNADKKKIDIKAKLSKDLKTAAVTVHTPAMDMKVKDIGLELLAINSDDLMIEDENVRNVIENNLESSCILDKTRAETFDGRDYPLRLGNCWHVAMTTYPKSNPENHNEKLRIPSDQSVSILAKETREGRKEVKILLGEQEIKLVPGENEPQAQLNGREIQITRDISHQERQKDDEILLEIYRLADNSIAVSSDVYDVNLIFDGKRILIKASDEYRNALRGLCGNFDGEAVNDFLGPQNCVMRKPEHFVASYALNKNQCDADIRETAEQARKECTHPAKTVQSNVISDVDAGRSNNEKWGYHQGDQQQSDKRCSTHRTQVLETDDNICFTIRPVVSCAPGCSPIETKTKNYQFHCMERNEASLNMKRRVEKGANPDLSQKSVSMSRPINVPLACKA